MEFLSKYKRIIESFLWVLILVFAYQVYNSINAPIKFNEVKNKRYLKVIDKLKDIRNAQIAYNSVNGVYADNFDGLIKFIDHDAWRPKGAEPIQHLGGSRASDRGEVDVAIG